MANGDWDRPALRADSDRQDVLADRALHAVPAGRLEGEGLGVRGVLEAVPAEVHVYVLRAAESAEGGVAARISRRKAEFYGLLQTAVHLLLDEASPAVAVAGDVRDFLCVREGKHRFPWFF